MAPKMYFLPIFASLAALQRAHLPTDRRQYDAVRYRARRATPIHAECGKVGLYMLRWFKFDVQRDQYRHALEQQRLM